MGRLNVRNSQFVEIFKYYEAHFVFDLEYDKKNTTKNGTKFIK